MPFIFYIWVDNLSTSTSGRALVALVGVKSEPSISFDLNIRSETGRIGHDFI